MSKQTKCPKCKSANAACVDTRITRKRMPMSWLLMDVRNRRYKCLSCNHKWSTHELPESYFIETKRTGEKINNLIKGMME